MLVTRKTLGGFGIGLFLLGVAMRIVLPMEAQIPMVWVTNAIPLAGIALVLVVAGLWCAEKSPAVATFLGLCLSAVGALTIVVGISGGGATSFITGGLMCLLGCSMVAGYLLKKR